ncbi:hypothetical protein A0H81_01328 [Grifola frondosa]|uniref:Tyr recombinase domain-containing protein n=1 Tax=Grifola frondosa TaxID=5627 RepID=A0A1C7MTH7_GRIFR|nr:hypothetical protein A0H81_01328 [Grifola frondosa]
MVALRNLARVVPAPADAPLFSWRDRAGEVRPMTRDAALKHINSIFEAWNWGTSFGHSFRIGGASFMLSQKIDPEIVRLLGRWKSLAYETYIRAFEQRRRPPRVDSASQLGRRLDLPRVRSQLRWGQAQPSSKYRASSTSTRQTRLDGPQMGVK